MLKKLLNDRRFCTAALLFPSLAGVMIFVFIPFADSVRRSFCASGSGKFNGLKNYSVVFGNEAFRLALKNTVLFTAVCLPVLIFVSFIIAYMISRLKHIRLIRTFMLFPLAVPTAVLVLVWKIMFDDYGYINGLLTSCGHNNIDFLGSSASFGVLAGSYIWKNMGYTVLLWLTGITGVSSSVIEAARIDGAGEAAILRKIILPELKPCLYTITLISFLNSFKVFREAYLVAGSYPHESIYLMQHLFNNWFANLNLDKMAAASVVIFAVIFAAISLLQKVWDKEA